MKFRVASKLFDNVCHERRFGVGFAGSEHHVENIVAVDLIHCGWQDDRNLFKTQMALPIQLIADGLLVERLEPPRGLMI